MRICLLTAHHNAAFIPLALLYLKAQLVDRGGVPDADVTILEFTRDDAPETIAEAVVAADADIVAMSCYVWNVRALMAAAELVKGRQPDVLIVAGGPEVGPVAVATLERHRALDVVVKSEGEAPFGAIVARQRDAAPLDDVAGICFRRGESIVDTGDAPILRDLNELASPHNERFASPGRRVVCVETQRGCVFRCNFCFYNKDLSIRNRRFDLARVKREIAFWLERDVVELYLMDPVFNLNAERAKEVCRFLAERNTRHVPIHAEVWAEFIDDELAALMRAAGFTFLEVGLQTTDETVLATVERRLRTQRFLEGIAALKKHGVPFEVQLIYGLPGDTREAFRRSLNFAASLDAAMLSVFPLMVLPGTELWRKADALGLTYDPEPPYYVRSHYTMGADDIRYGWDVTNAIRWLEPFHTIRFLSREPRVTFADLVDEWINERPESLPAFVERVCAKHAVPPEFYRASARLEAASAAARGD